MRVEEVRPLVFSDEVADIDLYMQYVPTTARDGINGLLFHLNQQTEGQRGLDYSVVAHKDPLKSDIQLAIVVEDKGFPLGTQRNMRQINGLVDRYFQAQGADVVPEPSDAKKDFFGAARKIVNLDYEKPVTIETISASEYEKRQKALAHAEKDEPVILYKRAAEEQPRRRLLRAGNLAAAAALALATLGTAAHELFTPSARSQQAPRPPIVLVHKPKPLDQPTPTPTPVPKEAITQNPPEDPLYKRSTPAAAAAEPPKDSPPIPTAASSEPATRINQAPPTSVDASSADPETFPGHKKPFYARDMQPPAASLQALGGGSLNAIKDARFEPPKSLQASKSVSSSKDVNLIEQKKPEELPEVKAGGSVWNSAETLLVDFLQKDASVHDKAAIAASLARDNGVVSKGLGVNSGTVSEFAIQPGTKFKVSNQTWEKVQQIKVKQYQAPR